MGAICSSSPPLLEGAPAGPPRPSAPQQLERAKTGPSPHSLLHLSLLSLCQHIETFATLELPNEIAQKLLDILISRAWLTLAALDRLRHCLLFSIELPAFAPLSTQGGAAWLPALATHVEVVRLDISSAAGLSDAACAHLTSLASLTALNISGCLALTDAALHHVSRLLSLKHLKMESLPRVTDAGMQQLWQLVGLEWLSVAGCTGLSSAATAIIVEIGGDQAVYVHPG